MKKGTKSECFFSDLFEQDKELTAVANREAIIYQMNEELTSELIELSKVLNSSQNIKSINSTSGYWCRKIGFQGDFIHGSDMVKLRALARVLLNIN